MTDRIWHYMPRPGVALCEADYANISKTEIVENVSCLRCLHKLIRGVQGGVAQHGPQRNQERTLATQSLGEVDESALFGAPGTAVERQPDKLEVAGGSPASPFHSTNGQPVNHEEAYLLACMKRNESNLARCYLDLTRPDASVLHSEPDPPGCNSDTVWSGVCSRGTHGCKADHNSGPSHVDVLYDILEKYSKDEDGNFLAGDAVRSNIVTDILALRATENSSAEIAALREEITRLHCAHSNSVTVVQKHYKRLLEQCLPYVRAPAMAGNAALLALLEAELRIASAQKAKP